MPDMEELDAYVGKLAADLSPFDPEGQDAVSERVRDMFEAAREDWAQLLGLQGVPSLEWLARFDRHFNRREIERILTRSQRGPV